MLKKIFDAVLVIMFAVVCVAVWTPPAEAASAVKTFCTPQDRGPDECVNIVKISMAKVAPDIVQLERYEYTKGDRPEKYVEQEVKINCKTHQTITLMVDRVAYTKGDWEESFGTTDDETIEWICKQPMPEIYNAEDEGEE